jgi:hypothetical protein
VEPFALEMKVLRLRGSSMAHGYTALCLQKVSRLQGSRGWGLILCGLEKSLLLESKLNTCTFGFESRKI